MTKTNSKMIKNKTIKNNPKAIIFYLAKTKVPKAIMQIINKKVQSSSNKKDNKRINIICSILKIYK